MESKNTELINEILQGAYDLHTHPSPSSFPRALNDYELVHEADNAGMAGVMIKSHYGCTAARAAAVNYAADCSAKAYGGLVLNWPTGGLNPYSVENSLNQGGIIIWMPTRDSKHCLTFGDMPGDFFKRPGITVLGEDGKLLPEVYDIMDSVKKYGAYLATGHLSLEESVLLCKEGRARNVNMILTHPEWGRTMIDGSVQKELADLGVLVEKNWINIAEGSVTAEEMADNIRQVGIERIYMATDRGQQGFEHPVEGMKLFIDTMLKQGFSEKELITMVRDVPLCIANRRSAF